MGARPVPPHARVTDRRQELTDTVVLTVGGLAHGGAPVSHAVCISGTGPPRRPRHWRSGGVGVAAPAAPAAKSLESAGYPQRRVATCIQTLGLPTQQGLRGVQDGSAEGVQHLCGTFDMAQAKKDLKNFSAEVWNLHNKDLIMYFFLRQRGAVQVVPLRRHAPFLRGDSWALGGDTRGLHRAT